MSYSSDAIDRISTLAGRMMHHEDAEVREFAARVLDLVPEAKPRFTLADLAKAPDHARPKASLAQYTIAAGAHRVYK